MRQHRHLIPHDQDGCLHAQVGGQRHSVGEKGLSHEQGKGQRHQEWMPIEQLAGVIGGGVDLQHEHAGLNLKLVRARKRRESAKSAGVIRIVQGGGLCVTLCKVSTVNAKPKLTAVGMSDTPPRYCHTHAAIIMTVMTWMILHCRCTSAVLTPMPCRAGSPLHVPFWLLHFLPNRIISSLDPLGYTADWQQLEMQTFCTCPKV
jgi:hypothetical protein